MWIGFWVLLDQPHASWILVSLMAVESQQQENTEPSSGHYQSVPSDGVYLKGLKEAMIVQLLKKPSLDPTDHTTYCPVLNIPFLGKVIQRAKLSSTRISCKTDWHWIHFGLAFALAKGWRVLVTMTATDSWIETGQHCCCLILQQHSTWSVMIFWPIALAMQECEDCFEVAF